MVDSYRGQLLPPQINRLAAGKEFHAEANRISSSDCFWYLPERFNGNKLFSYGGAIQFNLFIDANSKSSKNPDIVITGNGLKMMYKAHESATQNLQQQFRANIAENQGWEVDGRNATRGDIMKILADIDSIMVRACSGTYTSLTQIDQIELDYAEKETGLTQATSVEQCACPMGYRGSSCEECAAGWYRAEGHGVFGICKKCDCGGNEECEDGTGKCKVSYRL